MIILIKITMNLVRTVRSITRVVYNKARNRIKLMKLERENRKNVGYILYLRDRVSKLEEVDQ